MAVRRRQPLYMKLQGMDRWMEAMEMLKRLPAQVNTASLHAIDRVDGGSFDNAQIMDELKKAGRNWCEPDDAGAEEIAQVFADDLERRIQRILNKPSKDLGKFAAKALAGARAMSEQEATACAAASLTKAMKRLMKMAAETLSKGKNIDGTDPSPVDEGYARARATKYGDEELADPSKVGRASGDFLDNLAHGTAAIRLSRE